MFSILTSEKGPEEKRAGTLGIILMAPGLYLIKTSNATSLSMLLLKKLSPSFSGSYPSLPLLSLSPLIMISISILGVILSGISLKMLYEFLPKKDEILVGMGICIVGCVLSLIGLGVLVINVLSTAIISAGLFTITISFVFDIISRLEVKSVEENSREFGKGFYWGVYGKE